MSDRHTVLVQPKAPRVVAVAAEMTVEAWTAYHRAIWEARLAAHLHARYFSRMRRALGLVSFVLQATTVAGSGTAFAALTANVGGTALLQVATLLVAIAAGVLQFTGMPGRVQRAAMLEEAWAVRCAFWDDALVLVRDSKYLGSLTKLQAPEAALRRAEAELGLPQPRWYISRIQRQLIQADGQIAPQAA